jgi:hypothetical protein
MVTTMSELFSNKMIVERGFSNKRKTTSICNTCLWNSRIYHALQCAMSNMTAWLQSSQDLNSRSIHIFHSKYLTWIQWQTILLRIWFIRNIWVCCYGSMFQPYTAISRQNILSGRKKLRRYHIHLHLKTFAVYNECPLPSKFVLKFICILNNVPYYKIFKTFSYCKISSNI